ncbi:MAG: endo alpha-1,4 polygalactosaminidase [Pseudomonadota bacterium]
MLNFPYKMCAAVVVGGGVLAGCQGSEITPLPGTVVSTEVIAAQLDIDRVGALTLDDGSAPLLDGSWARYTPDTTWSWQLSGSDASINMEYEADVYVIDMFAQLSVNSITELHNRGRDVICYFSAGTYEPWRPDAELFAEAELGNPHKYYPQERWLDIMDPLVSKLMANRMDMAVALGCDGVELDNVDGWIPSAESGFTFTLDDQKQYVKVLANEAHKRNLTVALKNNVELIEELADYFDLVINEECFQYNECDGYRPMIAKGKPVFNAEYKVFDEQGNALLPVVDYPAQRAALCQQSIEYGFQTLFLPLALDGSFRVTCS